MGSVLSNQLTAILHEDRIIFFFSVVLSSLVAISIIIFGSSSSYLKCIIKRFIRIQLRQRFIDPNSRGSDTSSFISYYRNSLCHLQKVNDALLTKILQKNNSCAFFVDRSISFLALSSSEQGCTLVNEFREKVPLTTYDDYRDYINRMIQNAEKNLLTTNKIIYFATSSGTTAKIKFLPITRTMAKTFIMLARFGSSAIWRSLPSLFPSPEQRWFQLYVGKKSEMFPRSKDGTPMGPVTQISSAVSYVIGMKTLLSTFNILATDLIEEITDFETSILVQLVFALAVPNIFSYTILFGPAFIHAIKTIEEHFEEISLCIASANFDHSSFVRDNICDLKFRAVLSRALNEVTIEYGGPAYRLERAEHIRNECLKRNEPGILHRLWPTLVYACTTTGASFAMYKNEIQYYCGKRLPLINMIIYCGSEGFFGSLASIHTEEYFLSPTSVFFEFIKEEDIHQSQPKTLLISEIEPGHRYELVITTDAGLVRYRMGDVINCTRFLSRADDLMPLPSKPVEIPRIPLISIAYRVGSLLDVFGEKTTEQHVMHALKETVDQWKNRGISVDLCDFTAYARLDVFPSHYVIFLELIDEQGHKIHNEQLQMLQNSADSEVEQQLCKANDGYQWTRNVKKLASLVCILVQSGTFSIFLNKKLVTDRVTPLQIKPHRLLKNEEHIRFFYDNQIGTSAS